MKLYDPSLPPPPRPNNEPVSMKMKELEVVERLPNYRLCKKKNGELVLQQMEFITKGSLYSLNHQTKMSWVDIETVEEGAE